MRKRPTLAALVALVLVSGCGGSGEAEIESFRSDGDHLVLVWDDGTRTAFTFFDGERRICEVTDVRSPDATNGFGTVYDFDLDDYESKVFVHLGTCR